MAGRATTTTYTTKQSAPVRTGKVLLIWQLSEKTYPDHRCSCGWLMERRKWQTPWPSSMVMETCYELCVAKHSRCWLKPLRSWLPDVKNGENATGYRESSHQQSCGACGRYYHTSDTNAHRDLTPNTFLTLKTYHVIHPSGSRTSLRDQCFFCLVHISVEFGYSLGFGTTGDRGHS